MNALLRLMLRLGLADEVPTCDVPRCHEAPLPGPVRTATGVRFVCAGHLPTVGPLPVSVPTATTATAPSGPDGARRPGGRAVAPRHAHATPVHRGRDVTSGPAAPGPRQRIAA